MTIVEARAAIKTKPQKGDMRFGRSAVSNGRSVLAGYAGRGKWARRWRDRYAQIIAEFGPDANDEAMRLATLYVECEKRDLKSASSEDIIDASKYALLTGQIARTRRRLKQLHSGANDKDGRARPARASAAPGSLGELLVKDFEAQEK